MSFVSTINMSIVGLGSTVWTSRNINAIDQGRHARPFNQSDTCCRHVFVVKVSSSTIDKVSTVRDITSRTID